jgi:zinc transport system permease protein
MNALLISSFLAALFASVACGIIGSYVVVKRIAFLSGGVSHAVLGGIGIALWLERAKGVSSASPLLGALIAGVISSLLMGYVYMRYKERQDTLIAAIWALGMSLGILFIAATPGYNTELSNYLVGSLLWVSNQDLRWLFVLDLFLIATTFILHTRFLALCFDENQAKLQRLSIELYYMLLLLLIAVTVVMLVQVVGIVLTMAMLTIPAAMANLFTTRLSHMMCIAVAFSALFFVLGTGVSFFFDWPTGATIACIASLGYFSTLVIHK